jgi:phosphatidylserine/phosphatidylglycerophosphate/cardiolipin synthase-like enzyme
MGLPRDLVQLGEDLRKAAIDPFAPATQSGLRADPRFASMLSRIGTKDAAGTLRLCLKALRVQHDEIRPRLVDAELVATLPPEMPGIARPTQRVVSDMILTAKTEVILLGYELTDHDLVQLLAAAVHRGVDVVMICDRVRGVGRRVAEAWPRGVGRPKIFHDRARVDGAPYASMHAKCLLTDAHELLVTSANFTFHGMHGNIEIGVRLSGAPAHEARKIFSHLVDQRVVEECPWDS